MHSSNIYAQTTIVQYYIHKISKIAYTSKLLKMGAQFDGRESAQGREQEGVDIRTVDFGRKKEAIRLSGFHLVLSETLLWWESAQLLLSRERYKEP